MGHIGEFDTPSSGFSMSISRRSFIEEIVALSGAVLIPVANGVPLRSLPVDVAMQYLCDKVFASPAETEARVAWLMEYQLAVQYGG